MKKKLGTIFAAIAAVCMLGLSAGAEEESEVICPECGSVVTGRFCSNCGAEIESAEWTCPECGTVNTGNFCSNCGTARETEETTPETDPPTIDGDDISAFLEHTLQSIFPSPDRYTYYVQDYVGKNLASFGYTSLGGDRMEAYGAAYVRLVFLAEDGTYVDIENEDALKEYVVVDQVPEANTEIKLTYEKDEDGEEYENLVDFQSIEEIDLKVARVDRKLYRDALDIELVETSPAADKYTYYVRNYVGKNLASIGYTSLGGDRMDHYGDGYLHLNLVTNDGSYIDVEDTAQLAQYVVTAQDIAPDTEIKYTYSTDSEGNEYSNLIDTQSIENITLSLKRLE